MAELRSFGLIFSNMHDGTIGELTQYRTTASVPFGGRYRLVDFHLSNFVRAGLTEVGVITRSNYQSLMEHLGTGREWDLNRKRGGLYILPPFHHHGSVMYRGRIEALANALPVVSRSKADYVVMADCHVLFNTDLKPIIQSHIDLGADITMAVTDGLAAACETVTGTLAQFGEDRRVTDVLINMPYRPGAWSSVNLFVMSRVFFEELITEQMSRSRFSFKQSVLQEKLTELKIYAYPLPDVCLRIGNLREYYNANMLLLQKDIRDRMFKPDAPVYTRIHDDVPARYGLDTNVKGSLIADGCVLEGEIENSVLFRGVRVMPGASVKNSILMRGVTVEAGASLSHVVADRNVRVTEGQTVMGTERHQVFIGADSVC